MSSTTSDLDQLVQNALAAIAEPAPDAELESDLTMRERFFELLLLILANLYGKTPIAASLFDRTTMLRVMEGMDDGDAGKLAGRTEDWIRLEGLARQQDGQKAYFLTRPSLAVLSTLTPAGTLGEVASKILKHYLLARPSPAVRRSARLLASYYLTRMARS